MIARSTARPSRRVHDRRRMAAAPVVAARAMLADAACSIYFQYAVRDDRGWNIEPVGAPGESDVSASIVVPRDGLPRVSWSELSSATVRY
ncbi:MAG: hypothetical protein LC659_02450, partial [Myxococcales bacterium]|nr:hypothetical protein [Myxococcales bacterium]